MTEDRAASWLQLSLALGEYDPDGLEECLLELGALAVTLEDDGDQPILEPPPGATPLWTSTRVTGLFAGESDPVALGEALRQQLDKPSLELIHRYLADQDWVRLCLKDLHPLCFGRHLWVCPEGHTVDDPQAVVVALDPGLAFGTGSHPTTGLCLQWLDGADLRGKTLIDYGCGSGILGIAALKLGAKYVWALDNDPQALLASRENALKNQVDSHIWVGDDPTALPMVDIIVANILAAPLIALAPRFTSLLAPGGKIVLSGLLWRQQQEVADAYRERFEIQHSAPWDNWVRLEGLRRSG